MKRNLLNLLIVAVVVFFVFGCFCRSERGYQEQEPTGAANSSETNSSATNSSAPVAPVAANQSRQSSANPFPSNDDAAPPGRGEEFRR